jgi:hypothetical protein
MTENQKRSLMVEYMMLDHVVWLLKKEPKESKEWHDRYTSTINRMEEIKKILKGTND